ncbi:DUF805 domain-containing protein [Paracoccaceae bacterium GXU_MW_L88]
MRKFVTFSGRASRSEYWWFVLATYLILAAIGTVESAIIGPSVTETATTTYDMQGNVTGQSESISYGYGDGPVTSFVSLIFLIACISAGVRRLHDIGKSGWWLLMLGWFPFLAIPFTFLLVFIGFNLPGVSDAFLIGETLMMTLIPVALLAIFGCAIWLLVLLIRRSEPDDNRFGPMPREARDALAQDTRAEEGAS